jgi:hypothetical protein
MYKTTFKFKGKCPKHTRFNPEKDGLDGVKGGCDTCMTLALVNQYLVKAQHWAKAFEKETNGSGSVGNAARKGV